MKDDLKVLYLSLPNLLNQVKILKTYKKVQLFIVKTNIHLYDNLISHLKISFHFHSNLFSDQFTFFLEVHLRSDGPPICDVDLRPTSTSLMAI